MKPNTLRIRAVIGVCGLGLLPGCGEDPVAPGEALTETLTTEHYVFHMAPNDFVDVDWQESYFAWITGQLAIEPARPLHYFKYRNRSHLASVTGRQTNGFAEAGTDRFHTIWPIDSHEGVHALVILHFGHPPALFTEGVAVAHHMNPAGSDFTARWNGQPVHTLARTFAASGTLPDLEDLTESVAFSEHDDGVTYPVAGSFVRYLLDEHGLEPFRALLDGASFTDSAALTEMRFEQAYGTTLRNAWEAWLEWIGSP